MTLPIRKGATHKVRIGVAVAVGDAFTPVTTLTLTSADEAEAVLHDTSAAVDISGYTWNAIANADGHYHLTLQTGISNTVGHLTIVVNDDSLNLPIEKDFVVMTTEAYDLLYADPSTLLTGADTGLLLEDTIGTVQTQLSYDLNSVSLATDDMFIGNVVIIEDAGDATNSDTGWIADSDQANNRLIVAFEAARNPLFTVAVGDKVRIKDHKHPQFNLDRGVDVQKINTVTVLGVGTSADLWRA